MTFKERMAARKAAETKTEAPDAAPTLAEKVQGFGSDVSPPPFAPYKVLGPDVGFGGLQEPESPEEPAKKAKGRPKGSKNKTKNEIEEHLIGLGKASIEAPVRDANVLITDLLPDSRWKLLVNVYPDRPYTPFSSYVQPVLAAVKEVTGLEDYRLVDFGKGAGVYATALEQYIATNPPASPGGYLVVDARTQEGRDALPTLERAAGPGNVFRGF